MAHQRQTAVEAVLTARISVAEARIANQNGASIWAYVTSILPPPVLIVIVAVFLSFQAWEYYNKAQQDAAKTKIEKAQAALAALEGTTSNLKVDDLPAQTAKLRAELDSTSAALGNKRAEAEAMRAAADAATSKSGLYTLEERAARAKLIITELKARGSRGGAEGIKGLNANTGMVEGVVRGMCEGNRYAELIDCPLRFIAEVDPAAAKKIVDAQTAKQAAAAAARKAEKDKLRPFNLSGGEIFEYHANQTFVLTNSETMQKGDKGATFYSGCRVSILNVHRDSDGVDDFYKAILQCPMSIFGTLRPFSAWISASDFNVHRASMRQIPKAVIQQCQAEFAAYQKIYKECSERQVAEGHPPTWSNACAKANTPPVGEACKPGAVYFDH